MGAARCSEGLGTERVLALGGAGVEPLVLAGRAVLAVAGRGPSRPGPGQGVTATPSEPWDGAVTVAGDRRVILPVTGLIANCDRTPALVTYAFLPSGLSAIASGTGTVRAVDTGLALSAPVAGLRVYCETAPAAAYPSPARRTGRSRSFLPYQ